MAYDLVIFDCDGVLVDSERLALRIDVHVLAQLGWEMTEDEVARLERPGVTVFTDMAELTPLLGHSAAGH